MWVRWRGILAVFAVILMEAVWISGMHSLLLCKCRFFDKTRKNTKSMSLAIEEELKCFPVPKQYLDEISYEDTYGAARQNGGHEGCDIMDLQNEAGRIPIVSATDGSVTNLGWLYLGGYRIGITSKSGIYFYYAHLDSYAANMCVGKEVKAGELLGFMGNTGEGEEGTKDKFDVHLHFGIYIKEEGNEKAVNPYPYLIQISYTVIPFLLQGFVIVYR